MLAEAKKKLKRQLANRAETIIVYVCPDNHELFIEPESAVAEYHAHNDEHGMEPEFEIEVNEFSTVEIYKD